MEHTSRAKSIKNIHIDYARLSRNNLINTKSLTQQT